MRAVRREVTIIAVILLCATLAMFWDVLIAGDRRLLSQDGEDLAKIFLYWQDFSFTELRHGNLPLWNPHIYSGSPYFAGFQPALLYPPGWIGLVLSPVVAINVGIALHVFLGGLWVYLWTRYRRLDRAACLLAALVFMFCGTHTLQIYRGHLPNLRTMVWAPLLLLSVDGWIDSGRLRWALVGGAAVAAQLFAGHIQEAFYTGIVAGAYALALGFGRKRVVSAVIGIVVIYAAGASLAAVQLLPGIDASRETLRTDLGYQIASTYAFPPENLLTLVLPGIFGDIVTIPYWGRWTLTEMCLFIGVAPFLLALYGARYGAPEVRRYSLAFAIFVLILACGSYTPLYRLLYDYFPGYGNFRGTTKFAFLATLFMVMLVAVGFDRALRAVALPRWPATAAMVTGLVLLAAAGTVDLSAGKGGDGWWARALIAIEGAPGPFYQEIDWGLPFIARAGRHAAIVLGLGGATFLVAAVLWHAARRRRWMVYALAFLGVVEVFTYARYSRASFDPGARLHARDQLRRFLDRSPGDYRILGLNPYVAMSAGADDVYGYDPMLLTRYAEFLAAAYGVPDPQSLIVSGISRAAPLLGMVRLRWVVELTTTGVHARFGALHELPRAFLVGRWRVITDAVARLAALKDPTFDPLTTVLLESAPDSGARFGRRCCEPRLGAHRRSFDRCARDRRGFSRFPPFSSSPTATARDGTPRRSARRRSVPTRSCRRTTRSAPFRSRPGSIASVSSIVRGPSSLARGSRLPPS